MTIKNLLDFLYKDSLELSDYIDVYNAACSIMDYNEHIIYKMDEHDEYFNEKTDSYDNFSFQDDFFIIKYEPGHNVFTSFSDPDSYWGIGLDDVERAVEEHPENFEFLLYDLSEKYDRFIEDEEK